MEVVFGRHANLFSDHFIMLNVLYNPLELLSVQVLLFVFCCSLSEGSIVYLQFLASSCEGFLQFLHLFQLLIDIFLREIDFHEGLILLFLRFAQFFQQILVLVLYRQQFGLIFVAFFYFFLQFSIQDSQFLMELFVSPYFSLKIFFGCTQLVLYFFNLGLIFLEPLLIMVGLILQFLFAVPTITFPPVGHFEFALKKLHFFLEIVVFLLEKIYQLGGLFDSFLHHAVLARFPSSHQLLYQSLRNQYQCLLNLPPEYRISPPNCRTSASEDPRKLLFKTLETSSPSCRAFSQRNFLRPKRRQAKSKISWRSGCCLQRERKNLCIWYGMKRRKNLQNSQIAGLSNTKRRQSKSCPNSKDRNKPFEQNWKSRAIQSARKLGLSKTAQTINFILLNANQPNGIVQLYSIKPPSTNKLHPTSKFSSKHSKKTTKQEMKRHDSFKKASKGCAKAIQRDAKLKLSRQRPKLQSISISFSF